MRRNIPRIAYGDLEQGDEFRYAVDLQATNLRLVASKQFAALQLAGGIGWDRYSGDAEIELRDQRSAALQVDLKESRTLAFLNAGFDLRHSRLSARPDIRAAATRSSPPISRASIPRAESSSRALACG